MPFKRLEQWQHVLDHPEMTTNHLATILHLTPRTIRHIRAEYRDYFK
jgi:plasmid maintenance system antidote protein VapI